jgi:hypothetical protein
LNPVAAALVADFEAAARSAQQAEEELRKKLAAEVARLERRRAFAFRRTRLVRTLAVAGIDAEDEEAGLAAQMRAVRDALGWSGESMAYSAILDAMQPLAKAVWQCACGPEGAASASAVNKELEAFETWFEAAYGKPFYVLFDQYVPEVPVVDF